MNVAELEGLVYQTCASMGMEVFTSERGMFLFPIIGPSGRTEARAFYLKAGQFTRTMTVSESMPPADIVNLIASGISSFRRDIGEAQIREVYAC
jgi:hypothetical protein